MDTRERSTGCRGYFEEARLVRRTVTPSALLVDPAAGLIYVYRAG